MYRLDLETLLLMLRTRSGLLETFLTAVPGQQGRCHISIHIRNGQIISCVLRDQQGQELSGEKALRLVRKKVLEWTYQEHLPSTSINSNVNITGPLTPEQLPAISITPSSFPNPYYEYSPRTDPLQNSIGFHSYNAIPHRTAQPSPQQLQQWTRQHRSIFMLIDGNRSIAVIAQLLRQDISIVAAIVSEMIQSQLVSLETYQY